MDSVDQIAENYKRWGGNPDKRFGVNLREYAERMTPKRVGWLTNILAGGQEEEFLSFVRQLYRISKPDTKLLSIVEEVANDLGMSMPACVYVANTDSARETFILPGTRELFVSYIALRILDREELRSLIAHEMHHFRQPEYQSHARLITTNRIDNFLSAMYYWYRRTGFSGYETINRVFNDFVEWRAKKTTRLEFEADVVAAQLTSPKITNRSLQKSAAYDLGLDIDSMSVEEFLQIGDAWREGIYHREDAVKRIKRGHYSYTERFANTERSQKTLGGSQIPQK